MAVTIRAIDRVVRKPTVLCAIQEAVSRACEARMRLRSSRPSNKAEERSMDIRPSGSVPTRRQPKESFTGVVWQDPIIEAPAPARIRSGRVSFEPGARTAWHTHPLGQTLHVISGVGRVQAKGGPIREIKAGDTVWIPPGEKHWHGAGPNTGMVHIAMQEALDGKHVEWMEYVSDEEYSQGLGG
jgi:quercetin dioxygenase-like cupin family protein